MHFVFSLFYFLLKNRLLQFIYLLYYYYYASATNFLLLYPTTRQKKKIKILSHLTVKNHFQKSEVLIEIHKNRKFCCDFYLLSLIDVGDHECDHSTRPLTPFFWNHQSNSSQIKRLRDHLSRIPNII